MNPVEGASIEPVLDGNIISDEFWVNVPVLKDKMIQQKHLHYNQGGKSMFSLKNDGSKLALVSIINRLRSCGHKLFDTQFFTPHLGCMGGIEISKIKYEKILKANITKNIKFQHTDNEKEFLFAPKKI